MTRHPVDRVRRGVCTVVGLVATIGFLASVGRRVAAQSPSTAETHRSRADVVRVAAANGLLSAVAAAISAAVGNRPVAPSFWKGLLGGGLQFVGKTAGGAGLGLVGREANAVGAAISLNAVQGRNRLDCLDLPIAIVQLHLGSCPDRPRVTLDLLTVVGATSMLLDRNHLDLSASARTGAVVFRTDGDRRRGLGGWTLGGSFAYAASLEGGELESQRIHHELVHVLQHDALQIALSGPLERNLAGRLRPGMARNLLRYVDFGVYPLAGLALQQTPLNPRVPLEKEAWVLSGH